MKKFFLMIIIVPTAMSCHKQFDRSPSYLSCTYNSYPVYTDTSTTIYIKSFNTDTSSYPNSNYLGTIVINAIRHEQYSTNSRSIKPVVSYTTNTQKDTSRYNLYYTGTYELINSSSGRRLTDSVIQYEINNSVMGNEIFSCFTEGINGQFLSIIAPLPVSVRRKVLASEVPKILVYDHWHTGSLVTVGDTYNSILFKTNDSTINYNLLKP